MATLVLRSLFNSVDFPALGGPTIAIKPERKLFFPILIPFNIVYFDHALKYSVIAPDINNF